MDITNIIMLIFGSGGILTGLASWFRARPEKMSYEIKNLRDVIEEVKKNRVEDKAELEEKLDKQDKKIEILELKDDVKTKAIAQWLKCHFIPQNDNCPVASYIEKAEATILHNIDELKDNHV